MMETVGSALFMIFHSMVDAEKGWFGLAAVSARFSALIEDIDTRDRNSSRPAPQNHGCQRRCSSTLVTDLARCAWPLNKSVSAGNVKTFWVTLFHKASGDAGNGW